MKAIEIIKNLINVVGSSVGVVMIAIGAVMFLGAFLKLYVFGLKIDPNFQTYQCDQIIDAVDAKPRAVDVGENQFAELTEEQRMARYDSCMEREIKREEERFVNRKKHAMIDGFTFVIVGLPILIFYMRRAKK